MSRTILITGDMHSEGDGQLFVTKNFDNPILIVCGDFGYIWSGDYEENMELDSLNNYYNCTILFIDGNHENFNLINKYPVKYWNGGWVHEIRPNILHLMRGEVFQIEGKTFAVMGGAESVDKVMRIEGESWWKDEIPNIGEWASLISNLDVIDWKVDYFLSHTAPTSIVKEMFGKNSKEEAVTQMLEKVRKKVVVKYNWYFGHMHKKWISKDKKFRCIYKDVIEL